VLAGYDTLYRVALSQSETAYNLGDLLFLGPLERVAAVQLTVEPLERMGTRWSDAAQPERLVDALGGRPDLLQAAGRLLLLRLRGERAPLCLPRTWTPCWAAGVPPARSGACARCW